jgi:hypothetical protein
MVLRLNKYLKLAKYIVSLHTMLLRHSTNFHPILQCLLHSSCIVDDAVEDHIPLAQIFMPKEFHLRQLVT